MLIYFYFLFKVLHMHNFYNKIPIEFQSEFEVRTPHNLVRNDIARDKAYWLILF